MTSLLGHCYPGHKQKTSLVFSAGLCTITWDQKDSEVAFRECSVLHYRRGMGSIFPRSESSVFWDLVIPWEQGLDHSPSKFRSPKYQTAEEVGQNPPKVIRDSSKLSLSVSNWQMMQMVDILNDILEIVFLNLILHKHICKHS